MDYKNLDNCPICSGSFRHVTKYTLSELHKNGFSSDVRNTASICVGTTKKHNEIPKILIFKH